MLLKLVTWVYVLILHCIALSQQWCDSPVRHCGAAMANTGVFIMEGRLLTSLFLVYRRALDVDTAQDEDRCVACSRTENHHQTDAGESMYRNTGICETCQNVLNNDLSTMDEKRTQCVALTDAGFTVAKQFLIFRRASQRLYFWWESDFNRAAGIAMGRESLPVARHWCWCSAACVSPDRARRVCRNVMSAGSCAVAMQPWKPATGCIRFLCSPSSCIRPRLCNVESPWRKKKNWWRRWCRRCELGVAL